MSIVLNTPQREQAGSDSYNRFEYQVHWIVCHIVNQLENNPKCIIFCEYHDDMAQLNKEKGTFEFYQIKTRENNKDWTIAEMSAKEKKADGFYKKSFLGFIYYNFLTFGKECSCCHFTSNASFDLDVRKWQSYIEDNKKLKNEDEELYNKIKGRIKNEYLDDLPIEFDKIFDQFIQNTFVYNSELQLSTYELQAAGYFFNALEEKKIPSDTANIIFKQILKDVRNKSKEKISTPISFKKLVEKKGIRVDEINEKIEQRIKKDGNYKEFFLYLKALGIETKKISSFIKTKQLHDARILEIGDVRYFKIVVQILEDIENYYNSSNVDINVLKDTCSKNLINMNIDMVDIDELLVEVLYYEYKFKKDNRK